MSDSEVIKEFLVAIGFKLDERSLQKFNGFMADTGKMVFRLASALTAAATGLEVFVTTVADKMEDLYWSSQRLKDSVANIQDYALGIQNLGGDAQAARGSLEHLMQLLRTNPGYGGLLATLGVNPNGGATDIAEGLRQRFAKMPYFIAARYAAALGLDEGTLLAMMRSKGRINGPAAQSGSFSAIYAAGGIDATKAARDLQQYMVGLRDLEATYTGLAVVIADKLLPIAQPLQSWLKQGATDVAKWVAAIKPSQWQAWLQVIGPLAKELWHTAVNVANIGRELGEIYDKLAKITGLGDPFVRLEQATSAWTRMLAVINVGLDAVQKLLSGDVAGASASGSRFWELFKGMATDRWAERADPTGMTGLIARAGGWLGGLYSKNVLGIEPPAAPTAPPRPHVDAGLPNIPVPSNDAARRALIRRFGLNGAMTLPMTDAQRANLADFGKRLYLHHQLDPKGFFLPAHPVGGGKQVNVHSTANITIQWAGNKPPADLARELGAMQARVHGNLLRNLKPAVQ